LLFDDVYCNSAFFVIFVVGAGSRVGNTGLEVLLVQFIGGYCGGVRAAVDCFADGEYELAAAELASAGRSLGLVVGRNADPDLLDEVFKNFCIGK